jgi:hypothetical protein
LVAATGARRRVEIDGTECETVTLVRVADEADADRLIRRIAASGCRVWGGRARSFDPTARRAMDHLR